MPKYFQLYLNSCKYNTDFDWIVFTDDKTDYKYPCNVRKIHMTFKECKKIIQSKFDFIISLPRPYKLCDIKPMYGYIFSEYLKSYRFWGHCDIDTLMGHLSDFITDDLLDKYDKLFCLGHMVLYKNTEENNTVFMREYNGHLVYKEVLTTPNIYVFDEENKGEININRMFLEFGKKVLIKDYSMNVITSIHRFVRTHYTGIKTEKAKHGFYKESFKDALYIWTPNGIFRYYIYKKSLIKENFMYIHLQRRDMEIKRGTENANGVIITPNKFYPLNDTNIDIHKFHKLRRKGPFVQYFRTTRLCMLLKKIGINL